jgi:pyruvate/2-oxoglutarate dehydrogenase complex dihydrolipoamide dehydrogenase (E3) component
MPRSSARGVALVEQAEQPGGDCVFTGCVRSKSLIASARLAHEMRTAGRVGLEPMEPQIDFSRVMDRIGGDSPGGPARQSRTAGGP